MPICSQSGVQPQFAEHLCAMVPEVEVCFHPHPAFPEAVASTDGARIYLNWPRYRVSDVDWLRVLGHEAVHLLQRAYHITATNNRQGVLYNDDPFLELEADLWGDHLAGQFAMGVPLHLPSELPARSHVPILQHMLAVRGHVIHTHNDLSGVAQALLKLIPYGNSWLHVLTSGRRSYAFESDLDLLAAIHTGIHGEPLMLFHKTQLGVHPVALQGLSQSEADNLVLVELGQQDNSVALRAAQRALARHKLLTENDLKYKDTTDFLTQMGIENELLIRSQSLADRIVLHRLIEDDVHDEKLDLPLQKEASSFAIQRSANVSDFADYYRFYMSLVQEPTPDPLQSGKRMRAAESLADSLSEVAYDLLWTPTLNQTPSLTEMPHVIAQWAKQGLFLGFPRLSAALAHIVQYSPVDGATGKHAHQIIDAWMQQLQRHWVQTVPRSTYLTQTGGQRLYNYHLPEAFAQLSLAGNGSLTIATYRKRTQPGNEEKSPTQETGEPS